MGINRFDFLDYNPAAMQSNPSHFPPHPKILEVQNVSVVRGQASLLSGLSLDIDLGQHTAILGPNGSGKSTLLKLLMRNLYPSFVNGQSGTIRIFGQTEWNVWDLRSQLGFVSGEIDQHFHAGRSGRLTAEQAVLTGFFSSELEPDPDAITLEMRESANYAMDLMGITPLAHRTLGTMSTGERRRTLLARSIAHRPKALVLDEPTAGLDLRAQRQLLEHLEKIAQRDTTLILVTHQLSEVLPCIDHTVLLRAGSVAFDGDTQQAFQADRLSNLFGCPLRIDKTPSGYWRVELDQ
jgi:iron complex transport system ATP-binding protein